MRKGSRHSLETREKIRVKTSDAMRRPEVREKVIETSFKKGNAAWNKGLKGIHLHQKTEFKSGELVGDNHPSWKGGVQKAVNDCAYVWSGANKRVRRPRKVYEDFHGKLPKGFVVYHVDGDRYNDEIDNLVAISRAELMRLNGKNDV